MVQRLIVPVDGSRDSWRAVGVAAALARCCAAPVDVLEVVMAAGDLVDAERRVVEGVREFGADDVEIVPYVELATGTVVDTLAEQLVRHPEATIVMSSHGRGRTAAVVGSVTEELLQREFGPIVVVGPSVESTSSFEGPVLVAVDGSDLSEQALPLAAAWGIELGLTPWVVEVNEPSQVSSEHLLESSYPARLARHMANASKHQTEYEVLHGWHPEEALAEFAGERGASLIVATTHGRTGLSRLRIGSTAAAIVRRAPCPVLLVRPPHVDGHGGRDDDSHVTTV